MSGYFLYEKNQAMEWHTNSDEPCLRMYFAHAPEDKKSFFRYMNHNREVKTSYDRKGWSYRLFNITKEDPLWHCVYSETDRYSIGFRIVDNL